MIAILKPERRRQGVGEGNLVECIRVRPCIQQSSRTCSCELALSGAMQLFSTFKTRAAADRNDDRAVGCSPDDVGRALPGLATLVLKISTRSPGCSCMPNEFLSLNSSCARTTSVHKAVDSGGGPVVAFSDPVSSAAILTSRFDVLVDALSIFVVGVAVAAYCSGE